MISLNILFKELAKVFDGKSKLEILTKDILKTTNDAKHLPSNGNQLSESIVEAMTQKDALPICETILKIPFNWNPPTSSADPLYIKHSIAKAHVELIGPEGLVKSNHIRLGLYGMLPNTEYGIRTHPADEIYIMLAGKAFWKVGEKSYLLHKPGERSFHPSMIEHANRTGSEAFMSVYVWHGDVSTENYIYDGIK